MLLIVLTVLLAVAVALIAGGKLRDIATIRLRGAWLALAGVVLQFAPVTGSAGYALLLASFGLLLAFAAVNLRRPGFILIMTGLFLNTLVIAADHGMPVTREALVRSGQAGTLADLVQHGGAKHHLAGDGTALLPLGDVIGVGWPVKQAVSVGDVCVHLGVAWCIVIAMRPPRPLPLEARFQAGARSVA